MHTTVNSIRVYFDVDGAELRPDGQHLRKCPVIVAIHGGPGFDHAYLKRGLAPLTGTAQIIYPDLRCQGRSERVPLESCTIEQMADDIAQFCTGLGLERPILLGHSSGGYVAMALAIRHPNLPGGLVLANTSARVDLEAILATLERRNGPEARRAAEQVFHSEVLPSAMGAFQELVMPTYTHPSTANALADLALSIPNPEVLSYFCTHLRQGYDLRAGLPAIKAPTLLVTGDDDWLTPLPCAREIADGIAGAEIEVLPETGHLSPVERPELFCARVTRFLSERFP